MGKTKITRYKQENAVRPNMRGKMSSCVFRSFNESSSRSCVLKEILGYGFVMFLNCLAFCLVIFVAAQTTLSACQPIFIQVRC